MNWTVSNLKQRLRNREPLLATFMKTPSPILFELMGMTGFDFVVLDKEHAPFVTNDMDLCMMAARAGNMPVITRLPSSRPEEIQTCLDIGGTGVLVPHICTPAAAADIVRASTYGVPGGRGYAGSTRAACYTTKPMDKHIADSAAQTTVIAAIEDPEAVEDVAAIAAVPGLDALFIGPMDLTVAYGQSSPDSPVIQQAITRICAAAEKAGISVGIFVGGTGPIARYRDMGVTFFLLGSEHAFILNESARVVSAFKDIVKS